VASDLQRAWPWHLSWSTWIFSLAMASVPPLARKPRPAARVPDPSDARLLAVRAGKLYHITFVSAVFVK
jgi:hypothetical protein